MPNGSNSRQVLYDRSKVVTMLLGCKLMKRAFLIYLRQLIFVESYSSAIHLTCMPTQTMQVVFSVLVWTIAKSQAFSDD